MSVSLVTACKNRNNCLQAVLPSWLQFKEIEEIVIVDWSSDIPLKNLTNYDNRIKVIRIDNEKYYKPSQANNLGINFATGDQILRVDTDYFFNPYYKFFEYYKIDKNSFLTGVLENQSEEDFETYFNYLYGLLFIDKENFEKVNGYNENIGYLYSHEDGDIFNRLRSLGLNQLKLKNAPNTILHVPHPNKARYVFFEGHEKTNIEDEIRESLSLLYTGEELEHQVQYGVVQRHAIYNKVEYENFKELKPSNNIQWNIQQVEPQYFVATKIKNKLEQIPKINCISLEESAQRRDILTKEFKKYNITNINFLISKRFKDSQDEIEGKLTHTLNEGTTGCCISHLKNIKQWLESTEEQYGFFCEDDLSLETVQYWEKTWTDFIETLPHDWECVQLLTIRKDNLSLNLRERMWNDWSATAYILKREYAQKIINMFCKDEIYFLELPEPNDYIQPLIENLLFTTGKTYTIPLFVENVNFTSTFVGKDEDINNTTQHKNNHVTAYNSVLNMWKNKNTILYNFSTDVDCPEQNFKTGLFYFEQGHTAPALSFFLRCAERTDDKLLAYEALIYGYLCYKEQKIRDETAKSLIMHAVCLLPDRPEARWLLSIFHEQKQEWMYAYYHACQGLNTCESNMPPLTTYLDYPGKIGLLFQKAVAGYWWEKYDESKNILLDLYNNFELNSIYKEKVIENLKRLNIDVT